MTKRWQSSLLHPLTNWLMTKTNNLKYANSSLWTRYLGTAINLFQITSTIIANRLIYSPCQAQTQKQGKITTMQGPFNNVNAGKQQNPNTHKLQIKSSYWYRISLFGWYIFSQNSVASHHVALSPFTLLSLIPLPVWSPSPPFCSRYNLRKDTISGGVGSTPPSLSCTNGP